MQTKLQSCLTISNENYQGETSNNCLRKVNPQFWQNETKLKYEFKKKPE